MKLKNPISLKELAAQLSLEYAGDGGMMITGINEIHKVEKGDLTFVDHPKYYNTALNSEATFILIDRKYENPEGKGLLFSKNPFKDYNGLTKTFLPFENSKEKVSAKSEIGKGTIIQPGVFIGNHVKIGEDCIIHSNVSINDHTEIGDRVIINSNTVIGSDAFYYKTHSGQEVKYEKMHSCGKVIIQDEVEIGASCTIDRGVSGDTVIGFNSKLDNQVHIGHGVEIGSYCLFAAQVGIAGKTKIKDHVILWGQVGVSKSLEIGENAEVYAQSGVPKSIEGNRKYFGSPVQEAHIKMKELWLLKELPDLWKKLNKRPEKS